jgi:putative ABC transport system permease protein
VGDVRVHGLDIVPTLQVYLPQAQQAFWVDLLVRTAAPYPGLAQAIRNEVAQVDGEQAIFDLAALEERLADSLAPRRFLLLLMSVFAAGAALLAAIGLYGLLAYSVAQRTQEIGLRLALGAERRDILQLVVGQGLALTGLGILLGIAGASALRAFSARRCSRLPPPTPPCSAEAPLCSLPSPSWLPPFPPGGPPGSTRFDPCARSSPLHGRYLVRRRRLYSPEDVLS